MYICNIISVPSATYSVYAMHKVRIEYSDFVVEKINKIQNQGVRTIALIELHISSRSTVQKESTTPAVNAAITSTLWMTTRGPNNNPL
jgi:hypothetical protein